MASCRSVVYDEMLHVLQFKMPALTLEYYSHHTLGKFQILIMPLDR